MSTRERASIDQAQFALPFDPMSESALMMTYRHLNYERAGITFEEACADAGLRLAMKNLAESIERRRHETKEPECSKP